MAETATADPRVEAAAGSVVDQLEENVDAAFIAEQLGGSHLNHDYSGTRAETPKPKKEEEPAEEETEKEEDTETAEEEETPAEEDVVETAAEPEAETTPVEAAAKPPKQPTSPAEPKPKPTEPTPEPKSETAPKKDLRAERKRVSAKLTDLRTKLAAIPEVDMIDHGALLKEINDTVLEQAQLQNEAMDEVDAEVLTPKQQEIIAEAFWDGWAKEHPDVDVEKAQDEWDLALQEAANDPENKTPGEIRAAARVEFNKHRLPALKTKKPTPTPPAPKAAAPTPTKTATKAAPPVVKGGARVIPAGANQVRRAPQPLSPLEMLERGDAADDIEEWRRRHG